MTRKLLQVSVEKWSALPYDKSWNLIAVQIVSRFFHESHCDLQLLKWAAHLLTEVLRSTQPSTLHETAK